MDYIEVTYMYTKNNTKPDVSEIVIALLSELGFDSFEETDESVKAYTPADNFNADAMLELIREHPELITSLDTKRIKDENWNQKWESNFPIAEIADKVVIYAPFHKEIPAFEHRICIMPQMSFGTGHHATTAMMLELMLDIDFDRKRVLDMGCGTGILAIFAAMQKAAAVTAIDVDKWAFKNAQENCERNNISNVEILQGSANMLKNRFFDIILANINRNVLLANAARLAKCLSKDGILQISGFYEDDLADIEAKMKKNKLVMLKKIKKEKWVAAVFKNMLTSKRI